MGATVPPYRSALDLWVRRGYVVVAPTFPLAQRDRARRPEPRRLPRAARRRDLRDLAGAAARAGGDDRPAQHRRGRALARRRGPASRSWRTAVAGTGASTRRSPGRRSGSPSRARGTPGPTPPLMVVHGTAGPDLRVRRGPLPRRLATQGAGDLGERVPISRAFRPGRRPSRTRRPTGSTATSTTTGGRSGAFQETRTCRAPPTADGGSPLTSA